MNKFVALINQFNKEEKDVTAQAEKNSEMLKNRLEAKIKSLEADLSEKNSDLSDADDRVKKAVANNTRNVDSWLEGVRDAEEAKDEIAEEIKNIEFTVEDIQAKIAYFVED